MTTFDVGAEGVVFTESWRTVSGATGIEVDAASLLIRSAPSSATVNLGVIAGSVSNHNRLVVTIPGGTRAVRTLKLNGFTRPDGSDDIAIWDSDDLDERLAVAVIEPGSATAGSPVHVVPSVRARGAIPRQLTGASFSGRVLTLPFLRAAQLELTRVENDFPEEFQTKPFSVSSVEASIAPHPEDVSVSGPDGALLFSFPGPFDQTASPLQVDLRVPLELALNAALDDERPLIAAFTVDAEVEGQIRASSITASGAVVRAFDEPRWVELSGRPVAAELPGPPLDARAPISATADVTIVYEGLRLHPLSSAVPSGPGGLVGTVVRAEPVVAPLPPAALRGERLGRVGIIGRAVGVTDLTVRLVSMVGGVPGDPLGGPGTISRTGDSQDDDLLWIDLPEPTVIDGPVGVSVVATRGAFRWVADTERENDARTRPTLLLAVVDDDPGGRPVMLGTAAIGLGETKRTINGLTLPASGFAGGPPELSSDLFCRVQLAHLRLRYAP